ncbi:hypothetical protein BN946_scf184840.g22 [Trametes cinnabarina]|uniref:Tc1-like transposase DDE domain-containing protein n=1 Tax=Pycnoporus cinnabarinus TaxID=5643 RepID=A0A060STS7_PYCCI|nr:hypothetical protein BN946_scf184840.g22 [Trametes cinnabarina]
MVELTPTKKARLYTLMEHGAKPRDAAAEIGCDPSTARCNYAKLQKNPDFKAKPHCPGRPRKIHEPGESTVRRNLAEIGLHGRIRWAKPHLRDEHVAARYAWGLEHANWTVADWSRVVFSDESIFKVFGSDGKQYCWRRTGEALQPQNVKKMVKHDGGKVMVWGYLTWNGPGGLYRINGNLNAAQYVKILEDAFFGTLSDYSLSISDIIFQQDNDPKHTSKTAEAFFEANNVKKLPWAASSPDMNIIENAWHHLDKQVRKRYPLPTNSNQLWAALEEEWRKLDLGYMLALGAQRAATLGNRRDWLSVRYLVHIGTQCTARRTILLICFKCSEFEILLPQNCDNGILYPSRLQLEDRLLPSPYRSSDFIFRLARTSAASLSPSTLSHPGPSHRPAACSTYTYSAMDPDMIQAGSSPHLPLKWQRKLAPNSVPDLPVPCTEPILAEPQSPLHAHKVHSELAHTASLGNLPFKWRRKLATESGGDAPPAAAAPSPLRRMTRSQTAASRAKASVLGDSEKQNIAQTTLICKKKKSIRTKRRGKTARLQA